MVTTSKSIHSEAGMHRKLVLFAVQLEGYLAHFPNCHKHALTQAIRLAVRGGVAPGACPAHLFTQTAYQFFEGEAP